MPLPSFFLLKFSQCLFFLKFISCPAGLSKPLQPSSIRSVNHALNHSQKSTMVVDYFLRGRQFGRFLANHTDAHERYGFTDQDIRWISRYCPETGANDNEVEYEEKWFNPRSLSTARMHWRRAMKKLNDEAHESEIEAEDDNGEEAEVEADPHPSSPFHPRTQPSSPPLSIRAQPRFGTTPASVPALSTEPRPRVPHCTQPATSSHSRGHNTHQPPMPYRASMSSRSRRQASGGEEFDRRNSSFSHGSRLYRPVEDGSRPHKKDSARKTIIQSFVCFFCFSPSG